MKHEAVSPFSAHMVHKIGSVGSSWPNNKNTEVQIPHEGKLHLSVFTLIWLEIFFRSVSRWQMTILWGNKDLNQFPLLISSHLFFCFFFGICFVCPHMLSVSSPSGLNVQSRNEKYVLNTYYLYLLICHRSLFSITELQHLKHRDNKLINQMKLNPTELQYKLLWRLNYGEKSVVLPVNIKYQQNIKMIQSAR